ncbi:MAG: ArsJ-associated glyceraldehyde-3-phosphate dehydrogenase [Alphaproteobacteria bacterium]|nr:ArsJ-associated glyceraldehyde-3-phosphate dehydrogenase [Alphaproteobacteria bacterium]
MTIRVGINGFGRMGRLALRAAWNFDPAQAGSLNQPNGIWGNGDLEFVHINEAKGGAETAAHLLAFDSVHGRWPVSVAVDGGAIQIGESRVGFSELDTPEAMPWQDYGVDIVLECTGKFKTMAALQPYFDAGVKKVIVAAPVKEDAALNIVMGVNDHLYGPAKHDLLTAASCTTNCLAPVVKVIHEGLGIRHGVITTIHDVTNTQTIVDAPHKDLRRARSSLTSLIPTTTGSAKAIAMIYPELDGKLNGIAVRVPILNASLTDCVFEVARETTIEEVNGLFEVASTGALKDILGYETRPLVSADFVNDTRSSIVDAPSTMVVDGTQVKVFSWYDNEYGYVCRMVELADKVAAGLMRGREAAE